MMSTTASPRLVRPSREHPIPVRRIEFRLDPETMPRDYYGNDAHLTLVMSALSMFFPEGERFFVDSVRHYRDRITDPDLLADIAAFAGQEAVHAKEHEALNSLIDRQGLPRSTKAGIGVAHVLLSIAKALPMRFQLAATVSLEHFTAILGEQLLSRPNHAERLAGPAKELWLWHALEESEHKTVAFDVYEAIGGSQRFLGVVMVPVSVLLGFALAVTYVAMHAERGSLFEWRRHAASMKYLFGRKGLFTELVPVYLEFFRPGFHPSKHDATEAVAKTNELLFGEHGLLREKVRQIRTANRPVVGRA